MKKWIWYQESSSCKVVIQSIVKDVLLQNIKKWDQQKNEEKFVVVKQSKKINPKKDKLIRLVLFELLHNVILSFCNSAVFRTVTVKIFDLLCKMFHALYATTL